MKSRTTLAQIVLVVLALGLAACTRSASSAPTDVTIPEAATPSMEQVEQLMQTQSAETSGGAEAQPTTDPLAPLPPVGEQTADPNAAQPPVEVTPTPEIVVVQPQPTVATTRPESYTLQKGEFPFCIARRFNVNPQELLSLNGLSAAQSNSLQPGLVLRIPATGNPFPAERALLPHPTQYTVQSGDSIYSIACKFGDVDPLNIAAVNGLGAPYTLTVGTVLQIP